VFIVQGQLERIDAQSVQLSVKQTTSTQGALDTPHPLTVTWGGADVTIPRADIASVREQHVSTGAIVAVSLVAVAAIVGGIIIANNAHPAKLPPLSMPTFPPES
jgi:hypothetical protein